MFSLKSQAGGIAVVIPWRGSAAGRAAFPAGGGAAIGSAWQSRADRSAPGAGADGYGAPLAGAAWRSCFSTVTDVRLAISRARRETAAESNQSLGAERTIRRAALVRTLFRDFEVPTGGSGLFCLAARLIVK